TLSPDPLLATVTPYVSDIKIGDTVSSQQVEPLLVNTDIFGVNLFEIGMADLVVSYFNEMNAETGAIRKTLQKYVKA
ncbi:MAG: mannitol dehydrogenase family protein, partial [Lachnospiraceae bacterium]|nr:mannitol dehydrogenase family protein [Lachnospiraceae bacterium]